MPNPITIKFECPGCGQSLESDDCAQFAKMTCPTCQQEFFPVPRRAGFTPSPAQIVPGKSSQSSAAARVRAQAESFCRVAVLFVVLGVLSLLVGVWMSVGMDAPGGSAAWAVMGACFSAALSLYVIGQIIHIRANTEK